MRAEKLQLLMRASDCGNGGVVGQARPFMTAAEIQPGE